MQYRSHLLITKSKVRPVGGIESQSLCYYVIFVMAVLEGEMFFPSLSPRPLSRMRPDVATLEKSRQRKPHPLLPIGRDPSSQIQVTASDNECCRPHIPYPGRPAPFFRLSSAISSLVVVTIAAVVFIEVSFCLINYGKAAVRCKDRLQGVVVALPLNV